MRVLACWMMILTIIGPTITAHSQTVSYTPLGKWIDPNVEALSRWSAALQTQADRVSGVRADARPSLPGLRSQNVELLTDALLRKRPMLTNNAAKARATILDIYQRQYRSGPYARLPFAHLRGYMAEAVFLQQHPEWGYVQKPNASQNDVYRWVPGRRPPDTGQIKYHDSGDPARYARDMVKDYRAPRFFVPDDHVEAVKAYLEGETRRLAASGDLRGADRARHNYGRVYSLGATSTEINSQMREAARAIAREKYATYTSLGAAMVLSLGPIMYDWARGDLSANLAAYRAAHALNLLGVWLGTDNLLQRVKQGALRGTVRGNAIVGTTIMIIESAWLLHAYGWQHALSQPHFYEELGGSVSALALGLAAGTYATGLAAPTGLGALVIGPSVGILTSTVAYIGGKSITHMMIEALAPEMIQQQEKKRFVVAKLALEQRISDLQNDTRK